MSSRAVVVWGSFLLLSLVHLVIDAALCAALAAALVAFAALIVTGPTTVGTAAGVGACIGALIGTIWSIALRARVLADYLEKQRQRRDGLLDDEKMFADQVRR